jgi:hypothetical protein
MAQKVQTLLIDDLDGGQAEDTIRFGLDGAGYEIDLSAGHANALRRALAPYVSAARGRRALAPGGRGGAGAGLRVLALRTGGGPGVGQVPGHRG